jgi:hypothetical protein
MKSAPLSPTKPLLACLAIFLFGIAALAMSGAEAFGQYTVTGKFQYEDREFNLDGFTGTTTPRPIRFAEVRIMAGNTELAKGSTTADGAFSINVNESSAQAITAVCITRSNLPGLLLEVREAKDDLTAGDLYSVASATANASGSSGVDFGVTLAPADIDVGKAFNIWDVANDAFEFVASPSANGALPAQKLTLLWRQTHTRTGSFFTGGPTKTVYVGSTSGYDDTIISHEVGHYIDNVFSKSDSPGGQHFIGDNNQDIRLSWGEGLATFIGSSIRKFKGYARPDIYVSTDGSRLSFSYEIEGLTGNATIANKTGSTNELAVTAALWDITDGQSVDDATPGAEDDPLERPFSDAWRVLTQHLAGVTRPGISIENFWDGWFSQALNLGALTQMQAVFATVNGIEFIPDQQEPDNSTASAAAIQPSSAPDLESGPRVRINEVDLGTVDALELYNAGDTAVDLGGWRVTATASGGVGAATLELPPFRLAPGAFVILSEGFGTNSDSVLYFATNISWSNGAGGACLLQNGSGDTVDFVRWGNSITVPVGTTFTPPNPPSPQAGRTLARNLGGLDTDAGADWQEQIPSLGSYNLGGQEKHHTYFAAGDLDHAFFNATVGRNYLVETLALQSGADSVLEIVGPDGVTIAAANDDFGAGRASRVAWTATASGKHYVRSRRYDGASNFAQYGSYDLRVIEGTAPFGVSKPGILTVSSSGRGARFQSVAAAVAASSNGDTIQIVDSGRYRENIFISGKSVVLKAAPGLNPVIDGSGFGTAAITATGAKTLRIEGLTISGGLRGIRLSGGEAKIVNTTIVGINDPAGFGDGIQVIGAGTRAKIVNCTIVGSSRLGIGVFTGGFAEVVNSIVSGNADSDISGDASVANSVVRNSLYGDGPPRGTNGNISGDPRFADPSRGNFRLTVGSAAIDRGDPGEQELPSTDADGIARSIDGDGNSSAVPDIGAFEYLPPGMLTSTSVFPQIAAGGAPTYRTTVVGMNVGNRPATVNISMTGSDANPFPGSFLDKATASLNVAINSMGTVRLDAVLDGPTAAGYAKLLSDVPLSGSAVFKTVSGNTILSEAGVGLSKPAKNFTVYIDNVSDARSGYAVANYGTAAANITLTLRDKDGSQREVKTIGLGAGQHLAEFAWQRFTVAQAEFEGSIEFNSDQNVAAVALRYDNPDQSTFSTIPVLVDETATTLYFPQVADGGGYRTNFILVNPSGNAATAKLEFFAGNGTPLSLPIAGVLKTSHEVSLTPRGVARLVTDGTASGIRVGWVKVTSPVALGGSAIFQTLSGARITAEAGVASSPLAEHFTLYVESLGFTESGLALSNPNPGAVTVTLRLRDPSGQEVGSHSFSLPPFGHTAQFFTENWFPDGFEDFEGTLEVLATAPVTGVALRYDNFEANVFATLPVVVVP